MTTETHIVVSQEWCSLLQVAAVASDDNFFLSGGDSLLAIELVERVEQRLGRAVTVDPLFSDGSLAALVAAWSSDEER